MPLQWLPLQQRQAQRQAQGQAQRGSPYSQALKPQRTISGGVMPSGEGFMEKMDKRQALNEERKYQEKMMKLQHDQQMEKMKFAARSEEDVRKKARYQELSDRNRAERTAASQQQMLARQKIEEDPEPAAREMYELMKTLPDESKQQLLQQIFTPSRGGTMSSGDKTIQVEGRHNPIANVFLEKGWAMMDASGKAVLSEPERLFEKGTFSYSEKDNLILNTATGEKTKIEVDGVNGELIADAFTYGSTHMGRLMDPTLLERISPENMSSYIENARKEAQLATMNYLLGQGIGKKEAKDIAYSIPLKERKTTTPSPTTKDKEADEDTADLIYSNIKDKKSVSKEEEDYYRSTYGDATWELVKKKMEKPKFTPPPKTEPDEEIIKKKEKLKIKDYLGKYKGL